MSGGEILIGYLIVGAAGFVVGGIGGFLYGLKKGNEVIKDLKRRKGEAESLLLDVRSAADKGLDDLEKAGAKVKDHVEKIFGEGS